MNKSKERILIENIFMYSKSLYSISNAQAQFLCEAGLVMQAAEVYDEFVKFRRSICDHLPLLNYADINFGALSEVVHEIAITIDKAMYKESNLRRDLYTHLDTIKDNCISEFTDKRIDFTKYTKLPNMTGEEAGHLFAGMFYNLSSLMEEIDGLLHYPEIQLYEDLYYKVCNICDTELFAIEQNLIDEIKQYPQRRKIEFLHELREKGIRDFKSWLDDNAEYLDTYNEKTNRIDEIGMGKCIYKRRRSYFDRYSIDTEDSNICVSISQVDESNSGTSELLGTFEKDERGIDEDALIDAYRPIINFIATTKFVNNTLECIQNEGKCNISSLLTLTDNCCVSLFITTIVGPINDYIKQTKNKGNWDLVKFICEYLGFIKKCSRKDFAESITGLMQEFGDSNKLADSMGKCVLTNGLTIEKFPDLKKTDQRRIEGEKIVSMFYRLLQMTNN